MKFVERKLKFCPEEISLENLTKNPQKEMINIT